MPTSTYDVRCVCVCERACDVSLFLFLSSEVGLGVALNANGRRFSQRSEGGPAHAQGRIRAILWQPLLSLAHPAPLGKRGGDRGLYS